ncbi:MAG TPA: dienelactone hydrolase family protein [Pseudolysinimonas sp.]|jgi:phospholipase/carboxylesterase
MAEVPTLDDDAVLWSHPEAERGDHPLLLLLHGRGSNEGDLVSLSDRFPRGFVSASLRAPIPDGPGFSWFTMTTPGHPPQDAVDAAADAVLAWLDAQSFTPSSVGMLGFSQGGVISLQTLRRAPERVGFALNLSGFVAPGAEPGDDAIAQHPVFWGRGDADVVIGPEAIARTQDWLPTHVDLEAHVYPGLPHSISMEELGDIEEFLSARL